jgi:hypothetical protein
VTGSHRASRSSVRVGSEAVQDAASTAMAAQERENIDFMVGVWSGWFVLLLPRGCPGGGGPVRARNELGGRVEGING